MAKISFPQKFGLGAIDDLLILSDCFNRTLNEHVVFDLSGTNLFLDSPFEEVTRKLKIINILPEDRDMLKSLTSSRIRQYKERTTSATEHSD